MTIESHYNIGFVAELALREKQIQQNYRPIIAVHKWFARRPGTLFRSLILSEFAGAPVQDTFYQPHTFAGRTVADPFMGGGTPLLEANRVGCDVIGVDINPMAAWVVGEEIEHLDLAAYEAASNSLIEQLAAKVGDLYSTRCIHTGEEATGKYFLWVKQGRCEACEKDFDLFQGYLLADDTRHIANVVVCSCCGELNEVTDLKSPGSCTACSVEIKLKGNVHRNKATCCHCGHTNSAPFHGEGPPGHRLFAIEYIAAGPKPRPGRLFKRPDADDLARAMKARRQWGETSPEFVPTEAIPAGDETNRLIRWGYRYWRELFNERQLFGLEASAQIVAGQNDQRLRHALATNLSDLLRYQNMLCRYDTMALKSLDIFSVHGFPVGYVQCESNILGIRSEKGVPVGSGGWVNITDKYAKAKAYCDAPFEVVSRGGRKTKVPIRGEWIGEQRPGASPRRVDLRCASSTAVQLPANSLDAIFTDPPYFGMVQYGELMEFCYVWLTRLAPDQFNAMGHQTTRHEAELTGNNTAERGLAEFTSGLAAVFGKGAGALKSGAPLVFTYHHNKLDAYGAIGVAMLDTGLTCSASLPCPAEMGGSIHIHGTGSSIVDTVFVCREHGKTRAGWLFENSKGLARIVSAELAALRGAGMRPTDGDIRCIVYGHLTRMAVWRLRSDWDADRPTERKLAIFMQTVELLGSLAEVKMNLTDDPIHLVRRDDLFGETPSENQDGFRETLSEDRDAVAF
ncbi:MAG TPA: hypothetical protein VHW05_09805 [Phenylobacterium sp.]|jgi:hypothetical protein|nr:hypothetical protein [Phenylobacterium sp.]